MSIFGFEDLIDPAFIGAEIFSILERLKQAKGIEPANSAFHLVTTDRIIDEYSLGEIISNVDGSIRLDKLFDGTTDRSRKGKVRKLWRQHLKLSTDQELEQVLSGFHIQQSQPTLEAMREKVNTCFQIIGLITCETSSDFRFDGAARALRSQERDRLFSAERDGGPLMEAACWAHARRKIHDVYISTHTATAEEALQRIGELYAVEEEIRGLPATERLAVSQSRSKPLLTSLHEWLVEKSTTLSKKSRLGEAFAYALNQWEALCYYCDDGLAEPDNNAAERALRAVCLGKKELYLLRQRPWWRTWSPAVRPDRYLQAEWHRPGSLSQIYPECAAGVAIEQSGGAPTMERRSHRQITVNTVLT